MASKMVIKQAVVTATAATALLFLLMQYCFCLRKVEELRSWAPFFKGRNWRKIQQPRRKIRGKIATFEVHGASRAWKSIIWKGVKGKILEVFVISTSSVDLLAFGKCWRRNDPDLETTRTLLTPRKWFSCTEFHKSTPAKRILFEMTYRELSNLA